MNIVSQRNQRDARSKPSNKVRVLVAYEGIETAAPSVGALYQLLEKMPCRGRFDLRLQNLELLNFSELRREAVTRAAGADMVILCVRGLKAISSAVEDWLRRTVLRKHSRVHPLVWLLDPLLATTVGDRAIIRQLRRLAGSVRERAGGAARRLNAHAAAPWGPRRGAKHLHRAAPRACRLLELRPA